jgi:hypothetical protein
MYKLMQVYTTEHGCWHLENKQDLFFKVGLPQGDVEGLFWWDEGQAKLCAWRFSKDEDDCFDDLVDEVGLEKLAELEEEWRPLATKVLQEMNHE